MLFRARASFAAVALALGVLIQGAAAPSASAAFPGENGKIVFTSTAADSFDEAVWSMNANGTGRVQLTDYDQGFDVTPTWSPDGTKILFARANAIAGTVNIWVMNADGSNEVDLGSGTSPSWSGDGTHIAFHPSDGSSGDIWKMDANGSNRVKLTTDGESYNPAWSPDGTRIAFERNGQIWLIKPDGTGEVQVPGVVGSEAAWSPDGKRLAFTGIGVAQDESEIFTVAATGGPLVNVTGPKTSLPHGLLAPAWSPDGTKLLFSGLVAPTEESLNFEIFTLNANGSGISTNLTNTTTLAEDYPNWQPSPAYPFGDIATSPFKHDIIWLRNQAITSGCTTFLFCPDASVTRGQMASFLARALNLSGAAPDAFSDDETSVHEVNINLVAREGIASGCGGTNFCPNGLVSREQMASFLARAMDLSGPAPDAFSDDETSIHEPNINLVAREGIATGCGGTAYCPLSPVTRGQMAAFLHPALD